jgi:hypothetical protein
VNGSSFYVKGVGYSPVPIGDSAVWDPPFGDYFTHPYLHIWQRDFQAMKDMNANVLRIYGKAPLPSPTKTHTESPMSRMEQFCRSFIVFGYIA